MKQQRKSPQLLTGVAVSLLAVALPAQAWAESKFKIELVASIEHSDSVYSVAFSPDGARVLSGGRDRTLKLWDVASGRLIRTFVGHADMVWSVAFSPDGARILSGSEDKTLKLWDAATGRTLRTFLGHSRSVFSVAFAPDGRRVLSGADDKTLKLWDVTSGRAIRTFAGHSSLIRSVAFSPDGSRILSGSRDNTARLWDTATGRLVHTFAGNPDQPLNFGVASIAFSPDGRRVISGGDDGTLKLWDAAGGSLIRTTQSKSGGIESVKFSPDGARLLSAGNSLKLWDAETGGLLLTFERASLEGRRQSEPLFSAAFSKDGARVVAGNFDSSLRLWDATSGRLIRTFEGYSTDIDSALISPDGFRILTSNGDKTLRLWDATSGRQLRAFEGAGPLAFSSDGANILSRSGKKSIKLWDAATGRTIRTLKEIPGWIASIALSRDGKSILAGTKDKQLHLWDVASGRLLHTFVGHSGAVLSVAFSPDGSRILSGSDDVTVKLWDVASGTVIRTLDEHSSRVTSVTFSADGRRILSGSGDNTIKVWDTADFRLLQTFKGHAGAVYSVAFSPDGKRIVSGSRDGTLKLWDPVNGRLLRTFEGHLGSVLQADFSPDGLRILSISADRTLKIWNAANGELLSTLSGGLRDDWMAITPNGFLATSPRGSSALTVIRGVEAHSVDQVFQALYNPDLVRESLAGDPDGEVKRAADVMDLEKVLDSGPAPTVAILLPVTRSGSSTDLVQVAASIADNGKGVGRVEWRVNGVTAAVASKPAGDGPAYRVMRELALDPGVNTIEVVAYNGSNLLASQPALTTVRLAASAGGQKAKLHVLAIGINKYVDQGWTPPGSSERLLFRPLGLAVKDATSVADDLKRAAAGQYSEVRVTLALDEAASRDNLQRLIDKLAPEISPRDTFIFFAAAHGISHNGRFYLIPQDYSGGPNPMSLAANAVDQHRLQDWFANLIEAKKAVILLDTCESGALVAGYLRSRTDGAASEASVGRLHESTGRPVLTAAALGQFAYEGLIGHSGSRHGLFTWALLDALRNGDTNGDRFIELSELAGHVQALVPKLAADLGGIGRSALALPTFDVQQTARFGSRGEDFVLVGRLQ